MLVDRHIGLCYSFGMRRYANVDKLLSSEKLQQIIQFGKQYADYVIIDTPPTGIATDAEVMAQYVDGVIMVVKQGAPVREISMIP